MAAETKKRLSAHYVKNQFYGFKAQIGGARFYFGKQFGIRSDSDHDAQRASEAATIFRRQWERLEATGAKEWTQQAKDKATADARSVLLGITADPGASEASETATVGQTAAKPQKRSQKPTPLMFHAAIDLFLAEQKERLERKKIVEDTYYGCLPRFSSLKRDLEDMPVDSIKRDQLSAMVGYYEKRPDTFRYNRQMEIGTVTIQVGALRQFFRWLYATERWDGFRAWELSFKIDTDSLMTPTEKRERREIIRNPETAHYTTEELATLYANSTPRTRLYMLLGLNCGMGQKEISTLLRDDCQLPNLAELKAGTKVGIIDRERNKTGVQAKWQLWPETAELLVQIMSEATDLTAKMRRDISIVTPAYRRKGHQKPDNVEDLAILTEDGYPLVHRGGPKNAKTDTVSLAFKRTMERVNKGQERVRPLGFYEMRRSAAQLIRNIAGYETHKIFLAHSSLEASGRKSVSEKCYTARTQADFDKVAETLVTLRKQIQPIFEATPLPKTKPGPKPKKEVLSE